jgi:hypothetical protein
VAHVQAQVALCLGGERRPVLQEIKKNLRAKRYAQIRVASARSEVRRTQVPHLPWLHQRCRVSAVDHGQQSICHPRDAIERPA